MNISIFDLFKIGIGPSSSHTVGPMIGAKNFITALHARNELQKTTNLRIELFGSLGATGKGHGTGPAVILGLEGNAPSTIDPNYMPIRLREIEESGLLQLSEQCTIRFDQQTDLHHIFQALPEHPNGMRISARDAQGIILYAQEYFSVGGGFILDKDEFHNAENTTTTDETAKVPYPFNTMAQLLDICKDHNMSIHQVMMANECHYRPASETRAGILKIWQAMQNCVERGYHQEGILPGGLEVRRRAPALYKKLTSRPEAALRDPLAALDWVNLYALAVNEENAAGSKVVTAPTNGAAGIIPAVLHYYARFYFSGSDAGVVKFLLTAAAIGMLCKHNASISGAEVGCQGEVGSACAMAAAGLAAVTGGTPEQIENAAEIAMEHNLGLTCDPIAGLVQIPCIERNAIAAVKAINASRMALNEDGQHFVSLDKVIKTMRDTGADMQSKYKETSLGGLAVNFTEC
ncbi:MAG: L-serine ammonia-lyase [Oceanospirillaceae bacterium]